MHIDVLNRFPDLKSSAQTTHLMKYIFPRQFGLQSVFTDRNEHADQFNSLKSREKEISELEKFRQQTHAGPDKPGNASEKLPKRLRGQTVGLVHKLRVRHTRCSYGELLNYYCPTEVSLLSQISHIFADFRSRLVRGNLDPRYLP